MDVVQDPVDILIQNFNYLREALFSPTTTRLLQTNLYTAAAAVTTPASSTLHHLKHQTLALLAPLMNPLLQRVNALLTSSPDIVLLVLLVLAFLVALQVLAWIRRVMLWLTALLFRLLFWAGVVAGVALAVQRGPEQTLRDLAWVGGAVAGFAAWVAEYWRSEYKRYDSDYR